MLTKNVNAFVDTLEMDTNARENLRYKLEDIVIRGVKDHLVDSYCKSLGWPDNVSEYWAAFREWEANAIEEVASEDTDMDTDTVTAASAVRELLTGLLKDTVGVTNPDASFESMYDDIVDGYCKQRRQIKALEAELENIDDRASEADIALAVNNLMVGFLRKTGYSDADLSEMSLAEMSSRIEHYMVAVDALATVAMDKSIES